MTTSKPYAHLPHGPVYRTWDEAMADPDFDPSHTWYVADPDYIPPPITPLGGWPSDWVEMGVTEDRG